MKLVRALFVFLTISSTVAAFAGTPTQSQDLFLKVTKLSRSGDSTAYRFSVCSNIKSCELVGRASGYPLANIKGLSGNAQKFIGAPVLLIGDTVGGVVVAFVAGSIALPAASSAGAAAILWGGAAVGGVGTSLVKQSSKLRAISPKYQWDKGSTKTDIERTVRVLAKDQRATDAIVYHSKNFDSMDEFYQSIELVERILNDL